MKQSSKNQKQALKQTLQLQMKLITYLSFNQIFRLTKNLKLLIKLTIMILIKSLIIML